MAKKKEQESGEEFVLKYDAEALANIALRVKASGFVPRADIQKEFGDEKTTQAIAVLYRDLRVFREVRRPWKGTEALGYEWADKRFSKSEAKNVPPELSFVLEMSKGSYAKYGEFEYVEVGCRYTMPLLGSVPIKDKTGDSLNCFERDRDGNVVLLRYHLRAMASQALPMIGKEASIARRIGWHPIRIEANGNMRIVEHAIVPPPGQMGTGKGIRRSESLPDGIEFKIRAMVPTSHLKISEFLQMLRVGGSCIGLSPGRSSGFGDFEVLGAE